VRGLSERKDRGDKRGKGEKSNGGREWEIEGGRGRGTEEMKRRREGKLGGGGGGVGGGPGGGVEDLKEKKDEGRSERGKDGGATGRSCQGQGSKKDDRLTTGEKKIGGRFLIKNPGEPKLAKTFKER